jgi:hypothetical protein
VIYSPFITESRIAQLEPQLKSADTRGVHIYLVTKAIGDRSRRDSDTYRRLEGILADWGVVVIHKRNMHEKLVFVDDEILWSGSLNPLTYSNTQEVMERRRSSQVLADYGKTLRLAELIAEYQLGPLAAQSVGARSWPARARTSRTFGDASRTIATAGTSTVPV